MLKGNTVFAKAHKICNWFEWRGRRKGNFCKISNKTIVINRVGDTLPDLKILRIVLLQEFHRYTSISSQRVITKRRGGGNNAFTIGYEGRVSNSSPKAQKCWKRWQENGSPRRHQSIMSTSNHSLTRYVSVLLGLFVVEAPGFLASLAKKSLSRAFSASRLSFGVRGDLGVSTVPRVVSRSCSCKLVNIQWYNSNRCLPWFGWWCNPHQPEFHPC